MHKALADKLFESHLREAVDIKSIAADHKLKRLYLFGRAVRVHAVQKRRRVVLPYLGPAAAGRTGFRNVNLSALCEIFLDLRDDHVGLVNRDRVAHTETQFLNNAYVMHAGPCDGGSLELNRVKYRYRVYKTRPGRRPVYLAKRRFRRFILPLEGN